MKKILILFLVSLFLLVGCQSPSTNAPGASGNLDFKEILVSARNEETNQAYNILYSDEQGNWVWSNPDQGDETLADLVFQTVGVDKADLEKGAISISLMNVQVYSVLLLQPVTGKEDVVMSAVENYRNQVMQSFQNYLPDQYEIAQNSTIEKTTSGIIVLVMSEDQKELSKTLLEALN